MLEHNATFTREGLTIFFLKRRRTGRFRTRSTGTLGGDGQNPPYRSERPSPPRPGLTAIESSADRRERLDAPYTS